MMRKKRNRLLYSATFVTIVLTLPTCEKLVPDKIEIDAGLPAAAEHFRAALETAARDVDLTGMKAEIAKNENLRLEIEALRKELIEIYDDPIVILGEATIGIEIIELRGTHRVDGWTDREDNWFWKGREFSSANEKGYQVVWPAGGLNLDYPQVAREMFGGIERNIGGEPSTKRARAGELVARDISHIANAYKSAVDNALAGYRSSTKVIGRGGIGKIDLSRQLGTYGEHYVAVRMTPVSADGGEWFVRARIFTTDKAGKVEVVKEFDASSTNPEYEKHEFNTPLPDFRAYIQIGGAGAGLDSAGGE